MPCGTATCGHTRRLCPSRLRRWCASPCTCTAHFPHAIHLVLFSDPYGSLKHFSACLLCVPTTTSSFRHAPRPSALYVAHYYARHGVCLIGLIGTSLHRTPTLSPAFPSAPPFIPPAARRTPFWMAYVSTCHYVSTKQHGLAWKAAGECVVNAQRGVSKRADGTKCGNVSLSFLTGWSDAKG